MLRLAGVALLVAVMAQAATLGYLSLDDMIAGATAIVRGRITGATAIERGPLVYTQYTIEVAERLKGPGGATVLAAVPGGVYQGRRQTFAGAPSLRIGSEYVLFLWTGPSGLTQVIGLSQGVLSVVREADGQWWATRGASAEMMLDPKTGRLVSDRPVRMALSELRSRVAAHQARMGAAR
jgi:hypothetical protein